MMRDYQELFHRQNKALEDLRSVGLPRISTTTQKLWMEILKLPHVEKGLGKLFLIEQKCWVEMIDQALAIHPNGGYRQEVPYQVVEKGLEAFLRLMRFNKASLEDWNHLSHAELRMRVRFKSLVILMTKKERPYPLKEGLAIFSDSYLHYAGV